MKTYRVKKIEIDTEKVSDYGMMILEDVKLVTMGYVLNDEFSIPEIGSYVYDRKNGKYMFFVDEVRN